MSDDKKELEIKDSEYVSSEFLFITFSILESKGYLGWNELMSILDDSSAIIKMIRLLGGNTIKIPSISEFRESLLAASYIYCDLAKRNSKIQKKIPSTEAIDKLLNVETIEEKEAIQKDYDNWIIHMEQEGYPLDRLFDVVRADTKRRFSKVRKSLYKPSKQKKKTIRK